MTPGEKAVTLLDADVGVAETPPGSNRNKYGKYWGIDGQPYCAMAVSWAWKEAGYPLEISATGYWGYVPHGYDWARRQALLTSDPVTGDIVLFGDAMDQPHTGLFVRWLIKGKTFETVEANTSRENDTDGIYVARRVRDMSWVAAFWHPKVAAPAGGFDPQRNEDGDEEEFEMTAVEDPRGNFWLHDGWTYKLAFKAPCNWDKDVNPFLVHLAAAGLLKTNKDGSPFVGKLVDEDYAKNILVEVP